MPLLAFCLFIISNIIRVFFVFPSVPFRSLRYIRYCRPLSLFWLPPSAIPARRCPVSRVLNSLIPLFGWPLQQSPARRRPVSRVLDFLIPLFWLCSRRNPAEYFLLLVMLSRISPRVNILLLPRLVVEYSVISLYIIPPQYIQGILVS